MQNFVSKSLLRLSIQYLLHSHLAYATTETANLENFGSREKTVFVKKILSLLRCLHYRDNGLAKTTAISMICITSLSMISFIFAIGYEEALGPLVKELV